MPLASVALLAWLYRLLFGRPALDACHPEMQARAPGWARMAREWLAGNPACAVCGQKDGCVPHHKLPVHAYPALELSWGNLITLCPEHHLLCGHLMDWRSWNPTVDEDCAAWRGKIHRRPYRED